MRVNAIPADGISGGVINLKHVFNFSGGSPIPFGVADLTQRHVELMERCVNDLASLDNKLRSGFKKLFTTEPETAASLVRRAFNVLPNENAFLEALIETLTESPDLCKLKTILYRVDGLDGGDRIVVNELNANPIGAFWFHELQKKLPDDSNAFNISSLPDIFLERIKANTGSDKAFFYPVRKLDGSSAYTEKFILKDWIEDLGIEFFMGAPESLEFSDDGVFVTWEGERYQIGYVAGLSSPEVFMNVPEILEHVKNGTVYCPSAVENVIGLCNKGMFCVLTEMREGRLDPALLGLSPDDLGVNSPIPNTYWLYDCASGIDRSDLFKNRKMVAKPIEGVGGKGILFSDDAETVQSFDAQTKKGHLIQDYYPSFEVDAESKMFASLDPYFTNDAETTMVGVLVRSALPGFLPNLTINSKSPRSEQTTTNLFSIGVQYG